MLGKLRAYIHPRHASDLAVASPESVDSEDRLQLLDVCVELGNSLHALSVCDYLPGLAACADDVGDDISQTEVIFKEHPVCAWAEHLSRQLAEAFNAQLGL